MYRHKKLILVLIIVASLYSCSSTTKKYFSKITGEVVINNKPVSEAKVRLSLKSNSFEKNYSFFTKTDLNGNFIFPEISKLKFIGGYVGHANMSSSGSSTNYLEKLKIEITFNSKKYIGVIGTKKFIQAYESYNSISFNCDLNDNVKKQVLNKSINYEGICVTIIPS